MRSCCEFIKRIYAIISVTALCLISVLLITSPITASKASSLNEVAIPEALSDKQAKLLANWYQQLGLRQADESFGDLMARAALLQKGKSYFNPPEFAGLETLRVNLDTFNCVSLIESSLAVARCIWRNTADEPCFIKELTKVRYRGGQLTGFASKLHYFDEWISDNAERGILSDLSRQFGAAKKNHQANYVTTHKKRYPPLQDPTVFQQMLDIEAKLRAKPAWVIDREKVAQAQQNLQTGDILAVVGAKPSLLVRHAVMVYRDAKNKPHVLHASRYNHRVLLEHSDVATYIKRRSDRRGIIVARPLAPK
ncbi:MAG: DUF1460 domain-containing protein [Deltaproteobacteria bacterium]|nr:DUF1460 domain-containing protein [Deltaproteobacteria bacterium]